MAYFTKNAEGEFVEVADDTLLTTIDVTKHPDYIKAASRIGELNKESEKHRKRAQALEQLLKDEPESSETQDKPDKTASTPAPAIDVDALRQQIVKETLDALKTAQEQANSTEQALDALLIKHQLPKALKPALQAAGSIDKATVLAQQLGEAKLVFPTMDGGNSQADRGVVSSDVLKRIEKDVYGFKD